MKNSTKEFFHLCNPLGLESPWLNPIAVKKAYKVWRHSQRLNKWRNFRNWIYKHVLFKRFYTNGTGWKVTL